MKAPLNVLIASPRGFCAGVHRAIRIVEVALEKYGAPVYVRHEIVHNKFVVEDLEKKGAVFVDDLAEVPDNVPVVFSAHGVPKSVPAAAEARNMFYLDATCPLVSKVHREAERHDRLGHHIILIGHAGHPEVIGTLGQVPAGHITLIETVSDVQNLAFEDEVELAYTTQTTLSIDDTAEVINALKERFPRIKGPNKEDICYATTNRQTAAKSIAEQTDKMIVIGAPNSSNSVRLVEVGERHGTPARLVQRARDLDWAWLEGTSRLGITAGASAPEVLVEEILEALSTRYDIKTEQVITGEESITFKLPPVLTKKAD